MKKILIALCAVATLASCTKNEVLSYDKEAIGFDNAFVDNATRSVVDLSYTNENLFTDFQVYGYVEGAPLFNEDNSGVTVAGSGINGEWNYTGTQYWIAGAHYNFSAVAPFTNGGWEKIDTTDATQTTLSFTNNGTTDLLYAQNDTYTAKTDGTQNGKVGFTFRHVLSKVKFSFKNAYNATNSSIRVKDIKILNPYKTGNVVLKATTAATPTEWSNQAVDANFVLNFGNAALNETDNSATKDENDKGCAFGYDTTIESYKELFMIPGATTNTLTNADGSITYNYIVEFTVELLVNSQEIKQYTHTIYTTFAPEPGKAYDLVATIDATNIDPTTSQEPIEFTVTTITDWVNDGTTDTDGDDQKDTTI